MATGGFEGVRRGWLLAVLVAALPLAQADEVEDRVGRGLAAYRKGQYAEALQALAVASSAVQAKLAGEYRNLLPPAPAGWEAEDAEVRAITVPAADGGSGVQLSRRYFREEEELALEVAVDSPLIAGLDLMLSDPKLLASDPAVRPYRIGDNRGLIRRHGDDLEVSVMVGRRVLVRVSGSNLKEDAEAESLLSSIDFAGLSQRLLN
ncbi:hypothetical protein [Plasticicumulans sp.]|uniref:hypothetical protein n=1 Tax=Plasticicumulans sp. TaxID=2307179 RepID=UPI002C8DB77D|nr:hypothetical protein [Plasticicumulans sp.]MBS0603262.1 hypothetical protein [Pseudomonadota bacterium]HMV39065.1 hypothetical protein [Plasticicumulans sp.]HMW28547.1 hypothetical protein [Plasticicumulans sp.]HMW41646.1 hypothetical protein [Plasticicumulans sp.]HMX53662.1 hypothetical protein [Plasticicumulans sp.]